MRLVLFIAIEPARCALSTDPSISSELSTELAASFAEVTASFARSAVTIVASVIAAESTIGSINTSAGTLPMYPTR